VEKYLRLRPVISAMCFVKARERDNKGETPNFAVLLNVRLPYHCHLGLWISV